MQRACSQHQWPTVALHSITASTMKATSADSSGHFANTHLRKAAVISVLQQQLLSRRLHCQWPIRRVITSRNTEEIALCSFVSRFLFFLRCTACGLFALV